MRSKILLLAVTATAALSTAPAAMAADDLGDFQVQWGSLTNRENDNGRFHKANRPAARYLKRSGTMNAVVDEVNQRWALPRDLPILFSDALDVGPAFIPNLPLDDGPELTFINFPGSFLTLQVQALRPYVRDIKGFGPKAAMVASNEFVVAHEMGHALVHELDLPVTGREEDAVDGFAAYLLADNPEGPLAALSAAMFFAALTEQRGPLADSDFADEHSVHEQRVYQFLCWLYGSDPKEYRDLLGRDGLPRARAARCSDEWAQVNKSWDALLAPYAK